MRGSGTNGYVQRNVSSLKSKRMPLPRMEEQQARMDSHLLRRPNLDIIEHERKRLVEAKCLVLQDELEEKG